MRVILHILAHPEDDLVRTLIAEQTHQPGVRVEVVDLNQQEPDYEALVERIFASDSVEVW